MRYRLEVENGKPKHYKGYYYIVDHNNNKMIKTKKWVIENIDFISNTSITRNHIYLVIDRYEKAIKAILNGMVREIKSKTGFCITEELHLMRYNVQHGRLTKLPTKPFIHEAWGFIGHYELDNDQIFSECLNQVLKEIKSQGIQIWSAVDSDKNRRLFISKDMAEAFATKSRSSIMVYNQGQGGHNK